MEETNSNPSGIIEGSESAQPVSHDSPSGATGSNGSGEQGSKAIIKPGSRTDSIQNADGVMIAWDVIEEKARQVGVANAAAHFKVKDTAVYARARRHKWKKIPDGRTLAKRNVVADAQLVASGGELSAVIDGHRARVYEKVAASIDKFKPKAPKNFKEFESADKIARRALGIDDDKQTGNVTLIKINEAIDQTDSLPHEIVEVSQCSKCGVMHASGEPCNSEAGQQPKQLPNESVQQGSSEAAPKTDAPASA